MTTGKKTERCEGWRRYGGAFSLGPVRWEQCTESAIVTLEMVQDGTKVELPACKKCWKEAIDSGLKIESAKPC